MSPEAARSEGLTQLPAPPRPEWRYSGGGAEGGGSCEEVEVVWDVEGGWDSMSCGLGLLAICSMNV